MPTSIPVLFRAERAGDFKGIYEGAGDVLRVASRLTTKEQ